MNRVTNIQTETEKKKKSYREREWVKSDWKRERKSLILVWFVHSHLDLDSDFILAKKNIACESFVEVSKFKLFIYLFSCVSFKKKLFEKSSKQKWYKHKYSQNQKIGIFILLEEEEVKKRVTEKVTTRSYDFNLQFCAKQQKTWKKTPFSPCEL